MSAKLRFQSFKSAGYHGRLPGKRYCKSHGVERTFFFDILFQRLPARNPAQISLNFDQSKTRITRIRPKLPEFHPNRPNECSQGEMLINRSSERGNFMTNQLSISRSSLLRSPDVSTLTHKGCWKGHCKTDNNAKNKV